MGLVYRLDASDITTMFTDAGKTIQVTDGASVHTWSPKSGSSVTTDAIQATSANRPTYRANYAASGRAGVEFDGSNDVMSVVHSSGWNTTSIVEVLAVVYCDTASTSVYRPIIGKPSSTSWADGFLLSQSIGNFSFGSPSWSQFSVAERTGKWVLLYGRAGTSNPTSFGIWGDSAASSVFTPRAINGSTTTPTTNSSDVIIGNHAGGNAFDGAIGELRVYTGGETNATITAAITDMQTRWGLGVTLSFSSGSSGGLFLPLGMTGGYER